MPETSRVAENCLDVKMITYNPKDETIDSNDLQTTTKIVNIYGRH